MAAIGRVRASLRVFGEALDPDEVSALLGRPPSRQHRKGDKINAVTVSLDLPFAMNRFCGAESITNLKVASDYQDRSFGQAFGTLIEELKILCRAVFVLDAEGKVVHAEYVGEVTEEPNYDAALAALEGAAG